MKKKLNCWEVKKCCNEKNNRGRDNICPVKRELSANGLNGGINGGRICWIIMDTYDRKKAQTKCFQCEFNYKVLSEEGLLNNCNAIGTYLANIETNNSSCTHSRSNSNE